MVNVNKFKGKLVEKGMNVERLAEMTGSHRSTIYRKLNNPETITIKDVYTWCHALKLTNTEATEIFFGKYVA